MGHITDMMAASDISQDVWGKGLEITNVRMNIPLPKDIIILLLLIRAKYFIFLGICNLS